MNQEDIGSTIKHLTVMYAMYYNQKYSRSGHVFQDTSILTGYLWHYGLYQGAGNGQGEA